MNKSNNYYQILQVDTKAEPEIIKAAYKRLASKYHPDINQAPNATKHMQEINLAYEILSDEEKRKKYDATINNKQVYSEPRRPDNPFYFKSGQKAYTPEELVSLINEHWMEAIDYLYKDIHFKTWLMKIYRNDAVKALEESVLCKNRHVGVDNFIRRIDPTLPKPIIEIQLSGTNQFLDFSNSPDLNVFNLLIKNVSDTTCVVSLTCSESSWITPSSFDISIPPYSQSETIFKALVDNMMWSDSFHTTLKIASNSHNIPEFSEVLYLKTTTHPKIMIIEKYIKDGRWILASESLSKIYAPEEMKYKLRTKITTKKVLQNTVLILLGFILNIILGSLADYFNIFPNITFVAFLPLVGLVLSIFYLFRYEGIYGKIIDSIIALLSAGLTALAIIYFPIIFAPIIIIIALNILYPSQKKNRFH